MERLVFATIAVKIKERGEFRKLSRFGDNHDLYEILIQFFAEIFNGDLKTEEFEGRKKFHLRLEEPFTEASDDRCLYGFLSSGVSGDEYKIIDLESNEKKADVTFKDGAFRDVFFYFEIPTNKQTGYLVIQRKGNFGAKVAVEKSLKKYFKQEQFKGFSVFFNNIVSGQVYERMMKFGDLLRVDLIKKTMPNNLEDYVKNGYEPNQRAGKTKVRLSSDKLPEFWKTYLNKIYKAKGNTSIVYEVDSIDSRYEEIEFQLEYNGKKKTFYVKQQFRIQPDIDVTQEYREKYGTILEKHKLAQLAKETIEDIFNDDPL